VPCPIQQQHDMARQGNTSANDPVFAYCQCNSPQPSATGVSTLLPNACETRCSRRLHSATKCLCKP
jgi:hypothetical protein